MRSEELNLFVEEFISFFEEYIKNAKELYQVPEPTKVLHELRENKYANKKKIKYANKKS